MENLSAKQLRDKIAAGQISSVEATEVVFKNIDEREPVIGAYVSTYRDRALEKAAEVDKRIDGSAMENFSRCQKSSMEVPVHKSQCKSRFGDI